MAEATTTPFLKELLKYLDEGDSVPVERRLFEAFTPREYALKLYRGLPRVYRKENPTESHIKKEFSHLPSLKRLALEKFLFPLYEKKEIPPSSHVTLFTWVLSDGWGDLIAAKEALSLLKERFPSITFSWVALVPQSFSSVNQDPSFIYYDKECPPSLFPLDILETLRSSDLILSIPTFYPHMEALFQILQNMPREIPLPRLSCIGQYGYLESSWFHPKSGRRSMGLHFLEKGILIRKPRSPNLAHLENRELLKTIFGTSDPTPFEIEQYLDTHQLYLTYLLHPISGAIYLHALLKSQALSDQPLDLCTPELGWFIGYIEGQKKEGRPILEGNYRVREIEVHYEGKIYTHKIGFEGKKVRILCPGPLSDGDFRLLVRFSGDFVGVRGDQSFSEVISAGRVFFYDGALHARYFIKDLLACAENRLSSSRGALTLFRAMGKAFRHVLPNQEEDDWVEESYFQEKEPWGVIANAIGAALQDPETVVGFKKFSRILAEEHSIDSFLSQLVQRELIHHHFPEINQMEEARIEAFTKGKSTLVETLESIQAILN